MSTATTQPSAAEREAQYRRRANAACVVNTAATAMDLAARLREDDPHPDVLKAADLMERAARLLDEHANAQANRLIDAVERGDADVDEANAAIEAAAAPKPQVVVTVKGGVVTNAWGPNVDFHVRVIDFDEAEGGDVTNEELEAELEEATENLIVCW